MAFRVTARATGDPLEYHSESIADVDADIQGRSGSSSRMNRQSPIWFSVSAHRSGPFDLGLVFVFSHMFGTEKDSMSKTRDSRHARWRRGGTFAWK